MRELLGSRHGRQRGTADRFGEHVITKCATLLTAYSQIFCRVSWHVTTMSDGFAGTRAV